MQFILITISFLADLDDLWPASENSNVYIKRIPVNDTLSGIVFSNSPTTTLNGNITVKSLIKLSSTGLALAGLILNCSKGYHKVGRNPCQGYHTILCFDI